MSDIFEQKRRQEQIFNTDPRIAAEAATRINRQEAEFQQNLNGQIQEYLRLSTLKENKYFAPLSDEDLIVLETAQEAGVMTEDEAYKQATSIALAKRYNMNQAYVRQNLEAFLAAEDIDTTKKVPRTVFNGFVARARTGINSLNMGRFGSRLIEMDASGNTDTAESIRTYLRALQQENEALEFGDESLAKNGVLRFLQKEVVGGTLESLPYTMYIMGASAIGSLFAGTAGARAAGFAAGWELVAGQEYFALTELKDENGNQLIDNDLARNVSLVVGAISSFIETAVWDSFSHFGRAVGKVTGKEAANSMTQRIVGKVLTNLHAKGFLYRLAKEGMEGLFRMAGEGGEEFFQQISEEVGTNLALEFQKERVLEKMGAALEERDRLIQQLTDAKTSTGDIFHNAFEALKGGAASSLLMGLPETVMNYHGSGKDARLLRAEAAVTPSEEAFVKKVENLSLWDGMNPEGKDRAIREYYKNRRTGVEADEARLAEELKHTKGLGEGYAQPETNPETGEEIPLGKAFKEKSGAYYSQLDEDTGIYKVGDRRMKTRTNLWADIQFHKDGGKVVVDSFHVRSDLDTPQFRREVFGQFAEHYAGKDITWEPGPGAVAENAVRDDLIQHNPLGEQAGLNYFSAEDAGDMDAARYRNRVVDTLARNFPASTSEEHAVMAAAWEAAAADRGLSLEAYVNQEFGSLEEAFTTEPNADIDAAAKEGKQVKGAVFFKNLARDAKATIYVTKKADLSTFIHEMAHVYRRRLDGELLAEAEGIWGKFDRKAEEQFAEDYEAWWREGKAPRPEMESFFRKFSEFLKKIYNAVSKRGPVSEEVRAFFEKLHANDAAAAETGAAETGAESAGEGAAGTDPAAAGERHEANRKLVEDRESFDKNNTGEAPKPVHENIGYLEKKLAAVNENTPAKEKYRIQASAARELQLKALDSLPDMRRVVSGIVDTINQKYGEGTVRFIERKATDENPKPVKDVAGIIRKLNNGDKINQILDVMGMTIVTRDVATLNEVTELLRNRDDVLRIKDRYNKPGPDGYRDILTNVKLPNGLVGEVQVNTEQMLAAKGKLGGHKLYEIMRVMDLNDAQERKLYDYLLKASKEFYGQAYELLLDNASATASSLDSGKVLNNISSIASREGFNVLSGKTSKYAPALYAIGWSSASPNSSSGSSKAGTDTTASSFTSIPSTPSIGENGGSVKGDIDYSGTEETKKKYEDAPGLRGAEGKKRVAGRKLSGHYEIKAAGSATASFDPARGFANSEGFWRHTSDGTSVNRRNYAGDKDEQAATLAMASRYSGAALGGIVLYEGKTISGNGREGAGQIAARQNTDGEYIEDLLDDADKYGFTRDQVERFIREVDAHPRLYFVVDETLDINDRLFAEFNLSSKKAQPPLEAAVNISKQIRPETVNRLSGIIAEHDSIEDVYKDKKALGEIFNTLVQEKLIGQFDTPQYFTEQDGLSGAGEDLLAAVMLGAVFDEGNIRKLQGAKDIRKKLLEAVPALVENKAMGGYSVVPELNRAAGIAVEVAGNRTTYSTVEDYARQKQLDLGGRGDTDIEIEFARRLVTGKKEDFAVELSGLNAVLGEASRGQGDVFAGGVERKEDIVRRYLGVKAQVKEIRERNGKTLKNPLAGREEKARAALENAGIAKAEAEGTLMQFVDEAGNESPGTLFQTEEDLLEEAAGYGSWKEFRDAYEDERESRELFLTPWEEREANIEKLRESSNLVLDGNAYQGNYELTKESILNYLKDVLSKTVMRNAALKEDIKLGSKGIDKIISYGMNNEIYKKLFVHIPELVKNAVFITDERPNRKNAPYYRYSHLATGIEIEGAPYTVHIILGENAGVWYYDHIVSKIEKGSLLEAGRLSKSGSSKETSLSAIKDTTLRRILQEESAVPSEADNAWYESFYKDARKAYPRTLFQEDEEAAPSRAEELDRRWVETETTREKLAAILKRIHEIFNNREQEPAEGEDRKEYDNTQRLKGRLERELPRPGTWKGYAANVATGSPLKEGWYRKLKGLIRKAPRDYRALFADLMGQGEYLEDLADTVDGEPAARLADPRGEREDVKKTLKNIVRDLGDEEIAGLVASGDVKMYDVLEEAYAAGEERGLKESKAALKALDAEISENWARFTNQEQRELAEAYDRMLALREAYQATRDEISRGMRDNLAISRRYKDKARLEKADYDRAMKAYLDLKQVTALEAEVREGLARREARAEERAKQTGMIRVMRALKALKEMKKRIIKRIIRNTAFERVAYDQAVTVKAIQRLITPSIMGDAQKWIGPAEGTRIREMWSLWRDDEARFAAELKEAAGDRAADVAAILDKPWETITAKDKRDLLRMLPAQGWERNPAFLVRVMWSRWTTDKEQFAPELMRDAGERAGDIAAILDKPWNKITEQDKRDLIDMLPAQSWVRDLGLKELDKRNRESAQLDIKEELVNGRLVFKVGEDLQRRIKEAVGDDLYNRILNKPLREWSINEAEELAAAVDRLVVEGKKERAAKQEARRVKEAEYRAKVREAIGKTKWAFKDDDSPEERKRKEEKIAALIGRYASGDQKNRVWNSFFDANLRRFTTAMDGGRKGIFTSLLYWGENDAYNAKYQAIAKRQEVMDKVMKDNKITLEELYRAVEIPGLDLKGLDFSLMNEGRPMTVDDVLYIMRGARNEFTRDAIRYGDLSNAKERAAYAAGGNDPEGLDAFTDLAEGRLKKILDFGETFFAKEENQKFLVLFDAIGEDYERNGERLNRVMIDMFNRPMWREDHYVPMNRRDSAGGENENRVIEDLMGVTGYGNKWVNRGMAEKRITIPPHHQTAVETGLYKTWAGSVEATEHLAAYGPLVQTLNAVFKGYHTAETRRVIGDRWGKAATEYIDKAIAEMANPNPVLQRNALDKMMRDFRGKFATAVLAWKVSGVLKQLATSPWPYLQEVSPPEYLSAALRMAAHYKDLSAVIKEKSIFMRNRDFDPLVKLIREQTAKTDSRLGHAFDKFNSLGMKGLAAVDWACVAPGWLAVYERQLARLTREREAEYERKLAEYHGREWAEALPTEEAKVQKALEETRGPDKIEYEAVALADDAVRRMQPSGRSTDLPPLLKGNSEVAAAVLQFQSALSPIWQNLRYDLPLAVRENQIGTIAGMVTGYIMAGVCLGILTKGVDDDDEDVSAARKILYYSVTQFSDSVPVIGDAVTTLLERLITGRPGFRFSGNLLPVVEKAFTGAGNLAALPWEEDRGKREERIRRAVLNALEAFMIREGLPASGLKELGRAAGIGDGEPGFNPEAFLGWR